MPRILQSLQGKIIAIILMLIVISESALALLSYSSSDAIFLDQTKTSMQSILTFRSANLASELRQITDQAASLSKIESLGKSMVNLKSGWKSLDRNPGDARKELQQYFVTQNPHPADEREKLARPEGPGGYYYSAHEELQPQLAKVLAATPFKDMLMLDAKGNVIYSYKKADTFAENATDAKFAATGLGKVFAQTMANVEKAEADDVPGAFSGLAMNRATGKSDMFAAVPLVNLGQLRGIFVFQVRDDVIGNILSMGIPAGSSEKTNIVTPDGTVIGVDDRGLLTIAADRPDEGRDAAAANDGMSVRRFARADGDATSFSIPLVSGGTSYLISESVLDSELQAGSLRIASLLALAGTVVLVLTSAVAWFVLHRMFGPLGRLATATEAVAAGSLDIRIEGEARNDEIGAMSRSLAGFRDTLVAQRSLEAQARAAQAAEEEGRRSRAEQQLREAETLQTVVSALGEGLTRMARGDLAYQIDAPFPPALESLRHDFNASVGQLAEALTAIGRNSNAVRAGTEEMRVSADQLAERTERQSASISETAAAIGQITGAVRQQMERAEAATRIARDADEGTRASTEIMGQTIRAMEAIQNSSQQINTIISVIDEIAFQTNLLALNAGVEAARAGESGKGFAVVAQEVRELAQRSAKAAKEISSLLAKSTTEVEAGVSMVEKAGQALTTIGGHVEAINRQIAAMMDSTREEAETLRGINNSVTQIEGMTQQNAAMVEETTASIHQLAQEAGEMDGRIGRFQLADPGAAIWRKAG
ncbi:MAG: HAMP domain-containing protein [Rhizobiaceae bacterium]|nr:HAMP domain-containing protein [Rhizobiaceae bacterium]